MSDVLKIGIIGLGKMGLTRYKEFVKHPHTIVTHGSDPNTEHFANYPDVACSTDAESVINSDVDCILVATPNRFTPDMIIASLDAGKHVFSEKPPGRTVEDIENIIEAEKRNPGLALKFGFNHRYHAGIQEAKRIIDNGRLGKILWMRGIYGKAGGEGFEGTWRSDKTMGGSGILLDQGIHMLDLFRYFSGDFTEIKSMVTTAYWDIPMEDNAFALLRDDKGVIAMLHSSSTQWKHKFSLEIYCSDGLLSVNGILSSTRSYGDETISVARRQFDDGFNTGKPHEETIYFDTDPSWELEIENFVDCVLHDIPVTSGTSDDALKVMQMVFAIYDDDQR
ncbi:MAG TPA: Gfo/Idh/MocA family oxidoreductase [Candidatus Hydrogenedentes bacterium]|nr:Gfo/Idh/MocA family oxidoreductase [Candidatus Hydrogenedentota bacterium]